MVVIWNGLVVFSFFFGYVYGWVIFFLIGIVKQFVCFIIRPRRSIFLKVKKDGMFFMEYYKEFFSFCC